jgi:hypothetical protein
MDQKKRAQEKKSHNIRPMSNKIDGLDAMRVFDSQVELSAKAKARLEALEEMQSERLSSYE